MNNCIDDTIVAISTPLGKGGIGIIKISGKDAVKIADKIFQSPRNHSLKKIKTHTITYGFIYDPDTSVRIDEVLVSVMFAPKTYTKQDIVEINCHSGFISLNKILTLILKQGTRLAEPGEFTKRAFLNGRIDLIQAEAVIDIIKARTDIAGKIAINQLEGNLSTKLKEIQDIILNIYAHILAYIDFPEEDINGLTKSEIQASIESAQKTLKTLSNSYDEGRLYKDGVSIAIIGKPNVGKSSLLNVLIGTNKAIVTEIPGTTRDIIEDSLNINGIPFQIMDTAGIRKTYCTIESEGIKRTLKSIDLSDIVIVVLDESKPIETEDLDLFRIVRDKKTIFVINKTDISSEEFQLKTEDITGITVRISALKEEGIDRLKEAIYQISISSKDSVYDTHLISENILITNIRHKQLIDKTCISLSESLSVLKENGYLEITAMFLQEALNNIGEIIGSVNTEGILEIIFKDFCIGK